MNAVFALGGPVHEMLAAPIEFDLRARTDGIKELNNVYTNSKQSLLNS